MARVTPASVDSWNTSALQPLNVSCDADSSNPSGISRFQLARLIADNKIQYQYTCGATVPGAATSGTTAMNDTGGGRVEFLDRHNVNCNGYPIVQFQLRPGPGNTQQYAYKCGTTKLENIVNKSTPSEVNQDGNTDYLDRHNVVCPDGSMLTMFQLDTGGTRTAMHYNYACGTLPAAPTDTKTTPPPPAPTPPAPTPDAPKAPLFDTSSAANFWASAGGKTTIIGGSVVLVVTILALVLTSGKKKK